MLEYRFIQMSLLASFLISILSALVGTFVVMRKMTSVTGSISHSAFGGLGIGLLLGINPIYAALPFTMAVSAFFSLFKKSIRISEESALTIIWSFGMSLGIILMNFKRGFSGEVLGYLFGSILAVSVSDVWLMFFAIIIASLVFGLFSRELVLVSFDEEFANLKGINTKLFDLLFFMLTALTVVILIKVAGVLVIMAFLTIPPIIAGRFVKSLKSIIMLSFVFNLIFSFSGMALSFYFNLPTGPSIVMLSIIALFFASIFRKK
ncbi:MAG: metal ABC transporter permease [bacterium]|nr:metal ABC transporter permease [bacterium]